MTNYLQIVYALYMENPVQPPVQQPIPPIQQPPLSPNVPQAPIMPQTPLTPPTLPSAPPIPPTPPQSIPQTSQDPQSPPALPSSPQSTPPPSPKSQRGLLIALVLIILLIILGTVAYSMRKPLSSHGVGDVLESPYPTQEVTQPDTSKENTLLPTGTNDVQLEKDLQSVDTKIGTAESDLGNVDQGLNDQSVNLTE